MKPSPNPLFLCFFMLVACIGFSGCDKKSDDSSAKVSATNVEQTVPFPDDQTLAALGPKNDIDGRWILDEPQMILCLHPQPILASKIVDGVAPFLADSIEEWLQIPYPMELLDRVVQAHGLPFLVPFETVQNGKKVLQQVVMRRRLSQWTFRVPVNQAEVVRYLLSDPQADIDKRKRNLGAIDFYDLNPPDANHAGRAAVAFPDDKNVVLLEGHLSDLATVFDGKAPTSATLARFQRMPASADAMVAFSIEGTSMRPSDFQTQLLQWGVPGDLAENLAKNVHAATLTVHLPDSTLATVTMETKDAATAQSLAAKLDGQLMQMQVGNLSPTVNSPESQTSLFSLLLNSLAVEAQDSRVLLHAQTNADFLNQVNAELKRQQAGFLDAQEAIERQAQLRLIWSVFQKYYEAHGKFPSNINAADGAPLLSWRVALLPTFGQQELFDRFKLEEPWDSETNKALLGEMPSLYLPLVSDMEPSKTLIRFFSSEGTPLANPELKKEDLKYPESTLMLLAVTPEKAVEWTRPDSLVFDLNTLEQTTGDMLLGVVFGGNIIANMPILPLSDERSEPQRKFLDALIRGLPLPETPASESNP